MKKLLSLIYLAAMLLNVTKTQAWSNDVLVSAAKPFANHSMVAKSNGHLFIGMADSLNLATSSIKVYTSTNSGSTWTQLSFPSTLSTQPINKIKMVRTFNDSV